MKDETLAGLRDVATSCIVAIFAGLILTKAGLEPAVGILYWLLFAVLSGLCISVPIKTIGQIVVLSIPCTVALILTMIARGALSYIAGLGWNLPTIGHKLNDPVEAAGLYLFALLATPLGVSVAILARSHIIEIAEKIWSIPENKATNLERVVGILIRIIAMVTAAAIALMTQG